MSLKTVTAYMDDQGNLWKNEADYLVNVRKKQEQEEQKKRDTLAVKILNLTVDSMYNKSLLPVLLKEAKLDELQQLYDLVSKLSIKSKQSIQYKF